jgi:D-sedoheptulose 7-phosphate isomerase
MFTEYIADIKTTLDRLPPNQLQRVVEIILNAWQRGKQVFVMGNGGSASTASHMACDLSKNTAGPGLPRLRVMSLNDNMALVSAHSNDNGYENVFSEQLKNFLNRGDVVIAISASGNSANVLNAIRFANSVGAITVGWSGYQGGQLAKIAQVSLVVPNNCIEQIEDIHLMLEHMVTVAVRDAMTIRGYAGVQTTPFYADAVAENVTSSYLPLPLHSAAD